MNQVISGFNMPCPPEAVDQFISTPDSALLKFISRIQGKVLVLGAGGKMGFHLCLMLANARKITGSTDPVIAVSRFTSISAQKDFTSNGIQVIPGDLRDPEFVASLPLCPVIFFLAGVKFGTSNNPQLLHELNVQVPQLVTERFRDSRIVAFSTGCVYPFVTPESCGADEKCAVNPVGAYAESCMKRELMFIEGSQKYGPPVALIRLNYSVEFRYGVLVDIAQHVLNGEPVDVTMGYVNVIWQGDAINQIIRCAELTSTPPTPINITGAEILHVRSVASRFAEIFDKPVLIRGTEAKTAWLSNAAWSHQLYGKPATSVDQMIQRIAAWLTNGLPTYGKPTGFQNRDGNF